MALKFRELEIGDPIYYVMLQSSCEDDKACEIQKGKFLKKESKPTTLFKDGKIVSTNKYEYFVEEADGHIQRLTLFETEVIPGSTTIEDSLYRTGNYRYSTYEYQLKEVINEYINKELDILNKKLNQIKINIDTLKSKKI